jgi:hypothetical protein
MMAISLGVFSKDRSCGDMAAKDRTSSFEFVIEVCHLAREEQQICLKWPTSNTPRSRSSIESGQELSPMAI